MQILTMISQKNLRTKFLCWGVQRCLKPYSCTFIRTRRRITYPFLSLTVTTSVSVQGRLRSGQPLATASIRNEIRVRPIPVKLGQPPMPAQARMVPILDIHIFMLISLSLVSSISQNLTLKSYADARCSTDAATACAGGYGCDGPPRFSDGAFAYTFEPHTLLPAQALQHGTLHDNLRMGFTSPYSNRHRPRNCRYLYSGECDLSCQSLP
jgi:hypothetical protein